MSKTTQARRLIFQLQPPRGTPMWWCAPLALPSPKTCTVPGQTCSRAVGFDPRPAAPRATACAPHRDLHVAVPPSGPRNPQNMHCPWVNLIHACGIRTRNLQAWGPLPVPPRGTPMWLYPPLALETPKTCTPPWVDSVRLLFWRGYLGGGTSHSK